jgi:hypothetical protein
MMNLPVPEWMFDALVERGARKLCTAGYAFGTEEEPLAEATILRLLREAAGFAIIDAGEAFALAALQPDVLAVVTEAAAALD